MRHQDNDGAAAKQRPHGPAIVTSDGSGGGNDDSAGEPRLRTAMVVYGTRPEAIKLAPVVRALRSSTAVEPVVAVTGQHRELLDHVHTLFGIEPDHDLGILTPGQTPTEVTARVLTGMNAVVREVRPDLVVVQGDTTTTFAGALAAFYERVPVVHVEAGLRTHDRYAPFPEEVNRRLTTELATLHLAATPANRARLLAAGVPLEAIAVTGNTGIDALYDVAGRGVPFADPRLERLRATGRRIVVVTTHRRESWGAPMRGALGAVVAAARARPDVLLVVPTHPNPVVRAVVEAEFAGVPNAHLTPPLPYADFVRLLASCYLVVTDSGGIQEEAPSLGRPVLVLRATTERTEAVEAGCVRLVGTEPARVHAELCRLLDKPEEHAAMARPVHPYGDGLAAPRCVAAIEHLLGLGPRLADFGG
jgi:UDP-N-acetylglucosamine 2-epimerase (non-hydrolysing)